MVHKVHKNWDKKKITGTLLIDVKGAFDHISRLKLAQRMTQLGIDNDWIG